MHAAHLAVRIAELVIFGALAILSLQRWRQERDRAALWWTATVGVLAGVVLASFLLSPSSDSDAASWARKLLVVVLLAFPYCLFRYGAEFVTPSKLVRRIGDVMTAAVMVWTLFLPKLRGEDAPQTTALTIFLFAIIIQWTYLSSFVTFRMWRAGRNQAGVARNRMRLMAAGAGLINAVIIVSGFVQADSESVFGLVTGFIAILCALFFFAGFEPPRFLRVLWRQRDLETLRKAEIGLMTAATEEEIAHVLLPHVTQLFGAHGSVLLGRDGQIVKANGLSQVEARAAAALAVQGGDGPIVEKGLISVRLRNGWLVVRGGQLSPFFGRDEVDLLTGLGVFTDLALERTSLFQLERDARAAAERANAELETFVYSVSHDLKSPLVSLLGFLDYLKTDVEGTLTTDGQFFLDRISASSMYMQALIQDLLELSRIGRVQVDPTDVDLDGIVEEAVAELIGAYPEARVVVDRLPVVSMNPLRARQLFTNLISNAVHHAGRNDVLVTIGAVDAPDGDVVLSVSDNGKGIPAGYREKVFGVFERLERRDSESSANAGTGIGLAVCRKIVEQAGGQITVSDNAPGARFSIRLPSHAVRRGATMLEASQ